MKGLERRERSSFQSAIQNGRHQAVQASLGQLEHGIVLCAVLSVAGLPALPLVADHQAGITYSHLMRLMRIAFFLGLRHRRKGARVPAVSVYVLLQASKDNWRHLLGVGESAGPTSCLRLTDVPIIGTAGWVKGRWGIVLKRLLGRGETCCSRLRHRQERGWQGALHVARWCAAGELCHTLTVTLSS